MYKKTELTRQRDELNQELNMLKDALKDATEELKENYQLKFGEEINLEILDGKPNLLKNKVSSQPTNSKNLKRNSIKKRRNQSEKSRRPRSR